MSTILVIDPRPVSHEAMVSLLQENAPVWGVEFTLPKLTHLLVGNIDGQHSAGGSGQAAISIAAEMPLPPEDVAYAVVRPDPDALGAIAVLEIRRAYADEFGSQAGVLGNQEARRMAYIAEQDAFQFGEWKQPTDPQATFFDEKLERAWFEALSLICADRTLSIEERVKRMRAWIMDGTCQGLGEALEKVQAEKQRTWTDSQVLLQQGNLVVLAAHTQGATALSYCYAPVAVLVNDQFRFPGVPGAHLKYTVCQFQAGRYADLVGAARALNELEQSGGSWGGSPGIIGSPQGVSSTLSVEQVIEVVSKFLKS